MQAYLFINNANTQQMYFIDIAEKYKILMRDYYQTKKNIDKLDINSCQTQIYFTNSGRSDWDINTNQYNSLYDEHNKIQDYPRHPPNIHVHVNLQKWPCIDREPKMQMAPHILALLTQ